MSSAIYYVDFYKKLPSNVPLNWPRIVDYLSFTNKDKCCNATIPETVVSILFYYDIKAIDAFLDPTRLHFEFSFTESPTGEFSFIIRRTNNQVWVSSSSIETAFKTRDPNPQGDRWASKWKAISNGCMWSNTGSPARTQWTTSNGNITAHPARESRIWLVAAPAKLKSRIISSWSLVAFGCGSRNRVPRSLRPWLDLREGSLGKRGRVALLSGRLLFNGRSVREECNEWVECNRIMRALIEITSFDFRDDRVVLSMSSSQHTFIKDAFQIRTRSFSNAAVNTWRSSRTKQ